MTTLKVSKGIIFIIIGILFLWVTFYNVNDNVNVLGRETNIFFFAYAYSYYETTGKTLYDFIQPTIINYLFSVLFVALGFIEIIGSGIFEKLGDKYGN